MGNCALAFGDKAKIEAASKTLKWKPVTDPAMLAMLGPIDKSAKFDAWAFKQGKGGYILALADNVVDGETIKSCSLITELDSVAATKAQIAKLLKAGNPQRDEANGQVTQIRTFTTEGRNRHLTFLDAEPMGMKMLNTSIAEIGLSK